MKFKLKLDGTEKEIEVLRQGDRLRATIDGQVTELNIVYRSGPYFVLAYVDAAGKQRQIRAAGHAAGTGRQLWVNGATMRYQRLLETGAAADGAAANALAAAIPAVVADVLVTPGAAVAAGDKLILLESMKMVIPIQAPYAGTVGAIHCAAGDAVQPGVQLIELHPLT